MDFMRGVKCGEDAHPGGALRHLALALKKRSSTKLNAYASLVNSSGICVSLSADVFYGIPSEHTPGWAGCCGNLCCA